MIGDYDKAVKIYKKALELNPESAECHFNIASAYNDKKDYMNALHHYWESLRFDPENVETMTCVAEGYEKLK